MISFKQSIANTAKGILNQFQEQTFYPIIHIGLCARSFILLKTNQIEFQYTLKQFSDKTDEVSKTKLFEEIDQLVNPEKYFECEKCNKTIPLEE